MPRRNRVAHMTPEQRARAAQMNAALTARSAAPPPRPAPPPAPADDPEPEPEPAADVPEPAADPSPAADILDDLIPAEDDPARLKKARLARAKRDATGFITEAVPHVTAAQLRWLTYRLETGDDKDACARSETDPYDVLVWMADPGFRATYEAALENKREGFKVLTAHLLPSVIRSLQTMLESGSNKDKKEAATLLLRAQGLLVDRQQTASPDAISSLFALLREQRPVEARVLDVNALPPGDE